MLGWYLLIKPYINSLKRIDVDFSDLIKTSPLQKRVSLLDEFKEYFEVLVTSLVGKSGRLVVLIDDLDRCKKE